MGGLVQPRLLRMVPLLYQDAIFPAQMISNVARLMVPTVDSSRHPRVRGDDDRMEQMTRLDGLIFEVQDLSDAMARMQ